MTETYIIVDGEGQKVTAGVQGYELGRVAQACADRLERTVYAHEDDGQEATDEGTAYEPASRATETTYQGEPLGRLSTCGSLTLAAIPEGYPQADASEWADFQRAYRAEARALAREIGRPVEVYCPEGSVIDVVEAL